MSPGSWWAPFPARFSVCIGTSCKRLSKVSIRWVRAFPSSVPERVHLCRGRNIHRNQRHARVFDPARLFVEHALAGSIYGRHHYPHAQSHYHNCRWEARRGRKPYPMSARREQGSREIKLNCYSTKQRTSRVGLSRRSNTCSPNSIMLAPSVRGGAPQ